MNFILSKEYCSFFLVQWISILAVIFFTIAVIRYFLFREEIIKTLQERTKKIYQGYKAIQQEKNKTHTIINNLLTGVILFNSDHQIILINNRGAEMLNIQINQIIRKEYWQLFTFPRLHKLIDLISRHHWHTFLNSELPIDQRLFLSVSLKKIKINHHDDELLVILEDITRQKNIEKIKSDFISLSAHQLRTPLSAMKWSLYLLQNERMNPSEKEETIDQLYLINERMINLVNDFLEIAKIEEGKILSHFSIVNIKNLIKFVISIYQENIKKKNLKIKTQIDNNIHNIEADPEKLSVAIKNLVDNAISYSPRNSSIKVVVLDRKDNLIIQITNINQGLLLSEKSRIFSKFFRGQNAIKMETVGSGLGLFISKNIIEAHHGTINFNLDQQNKSITFTITLPIQQKNNLRPDYPFST